MHKTLLSFCLATMLVACQTGGPNISKQSNDIDATATQEALSYYVQVRPADTNLIAVADDGKDMFFEFSLVVPSAMQVFDQDGQRLEYGRSNNLLAVSGLHRGVLLRIGNAATFVSIQPGAVKPAPAAFVPSPELASVRDQLERKTPWFQAMEQAIAKSEASDQSYPLGGVAGGPPTSQESYPIGGAADGPPTSQAPSVAPKVVAPRPKLLNKMLPSNR